jgi:hypothetical protein
MSLLDNRIKVATYAENVNIIEQGNTEKRMLILVLSGSLKLLQRPSEASAGEYKPAHQ